MEARQYTIRDALPADAADIARIYNYYVANTIITFEEEAVSADTIIERMDDIRACRLPWFVAELGGKVLGFSYSSRWKERRAYRYSAEVTVYASPDHVGKGMGAALYGRLLPALESRGMHAAVGVIALPNEASIKLHEKMGFRKTAHFEEVGFKLNRWIDVGCWQRIL